MGDPKRTRVLGPLVAYRDGFVDELAGQGFTADKRDAPGVVDGAREPLAGKPGSRGGRSPPPGVRTAL
jgi:hypothetical protein